MSKSTIIPTATRTFPHDLPYVMLMSLVLQSYAYFTNQKNKVQRVSQLAHTNIRVWTCVFHYKAYVLLLTCTLFYVPKIIFLEKNSESTSQVNSFKPWILKGYAHIYHIYYTIPWLIRHFCAHSCVTKSSLCPCFPGARLQILEGISFCYSQGPRVILEFMLRYKVTQDTRSPKTNTVIEGWTFRPVWP